MLARPSVLRVLLYHRLEDPGDRHSDLDPDLVTVGPTQFSRQLRHLARAYNPIDAAELVAVMRGDHALPARAVLVTFDDAYRDFLEIAWPLLRQHQVPAVLFVPTAFVDRPERIFWWDALWQMLSRTQRGRVTLPGAAPRSLLLMSDRERLAASRSVAAWLKMLSPARRRWALESFANHLGVQPEPTHSVLSWADLRQLRDGNVAIAAHSQTHELLDQLDQAELKREVDGSRDDVARELGACAPLFAYPNGNFNRACISTLSRAGFEAAFTTVHGASNLDNSNPLALRRDDGRASLLRFALNLSGPVAALRTRRHVMPRYALRPP